VVRSRVGWGGGKKVKGGRNKKSQYVKEPAPVSLRKGRRDSQKRKLAGRGLEKKAKKKGKGLENKGYSAQSKNIPRLLVKGLSIKKLFLFCSKGGKGSREGEKKIKKKENDLKKKPPKMGGDQQTRKTENCLFAR